MVKSEPNLGTHMEKNMDNSMDPASKIQRWEFNSFLLISCFASKMVKQYKTIKVRCLENNKTFNL